MKHTKIALTTVMFAFCMAAANAATATFNFTGAEQQWVVPTGVTQVGIDASGASGWSGENAGGRGANATGSLNVTPGETIYIYVGGQGTVATVLNTPMGGGFNGGGHGQSNYTDPVNSVGGGGGASDVRQGGNGLANRRLVAAGGGGSTDNTGTCGGDGGGLTGLDACVLDSYHNGKGATQSAGGDAGGALGQGGNADNTMTPWNGGGGGGYYGGGVSTEHSGGGGGSSYIGGVTGGAMLAGQVTGDGQIVLTYSINAAVQAIPTLSEWGMIILSGLMVLGTFLVLRRRQM